MIPEISVIMSVYNGEEYLECAIESVINQTFKSWELIIINDCSTDSTAEILKNFEQKDERIKVHTNEVNLKLPRSLNKAISFCRGKYIARMDSDDICIDKRLEKQYEFMENNCDIALSSCRFLTLKNGVYSSGGCGGRCDNDSLRAMLLVTNPILHPGVIAKAEVMKKLRYDETLTCTEDFELWNRIAGENLKMAVLPEYLLIYRLHDKQITQTTLEKQHKEVLEIQKKYFPGFIGAMDKNMQEFYINGVYFRNKPDIKKFTEFLTYIKSANKKSGFFKDAALDYAMLEILAEYKRCGTSKKDVLKAMLKFNFVFLLKEIKRRKKSALKDGDNCINTAVRTGLTLTGGTKEFPVFSKSGQ